MSHFQDINVQDLFGGPDGAQGDQEVTWTEEQKQEMNMRIAKARLQYRKIQMKAQRGGQGRYELRKRQLEMKNNHIAQSVDGVKPNNRLDPADITDVTPNYRAAVGKADPPQACRAISSKVKRNRAKREQKKKKQRAAASSGETIDVPAAGTDYDSIRLHLDEESALSPASHGASK